MEIPNIQFLIHWQEPSLWWALGCISFVPLFWNMIARYEHRTHILTSVCGSRMRGVALFAAVILLLSIYRDVQYNNAIKMQPRWFILQDNNILWGAYGVLFIGVTLVATSFYQLGFTGTFFGDYFGILCPRKVRKFPFNILTNPMYVGTTLDYFSIAVVQCSQAGLFLSLVMAVVFHIALRYEGPFTKEVYQKREEHRRQQKELRKKKRS